jgi:hypothetical protein
MEVGPDSPYWRKAAAFYWWAATERPFAFLLVVFASIAVGFGLSQADCGKPKPGEAAVSTRRR